jgi:hypothetical protein
VLKVESKFLHFAKQSQHELKELTPEDENVGSRRTPSVLGRQRKIKVILPNKANSSTSSRNQDASTAVTLYFCGARQSCLQLPFRRREFIDSYKRILRLPYWEVVDFAKQNRRERNELTPEDENVCNSSAVARAKET